MRRTGRHVSCLRHRHGSSAVGVRPRESAPELSVELLSGGPFVLGDQKSERFTMVVFFRGLHCPVCQAQLRELDRRLGELAERGIGVIAVSAETRERTQQLHDEWKLERLPLAYGLSEEQMRAWGLFLPRRQRRRAGPVERAGLFLIAADATVLRVDPLDAGGATPPG